LGCRDTILIIKLNNTLKGDTNTISFFIFTPFQHFNIYKSIKPNYIWQQENTLL
jgi:hypothetical protein